MCMHVQEEYYSTTKKDEILSLVATWLRLEDFRLGGQAAADRQADMFVLMSREKWMVVVLDSCF